MATAVDRQRFTLVLMSIFASLATIMAAVGIYGVVRLPGCGSASENWASAWHSARSLGLSSGAFTMHEARTDPPQSMLVGVIASIFLTKLDRITSI